MAGPERCRELSQPRNASFGVLLEELGLSNALRSSHHIRTSGAQAFLLAPEYDLT